MNQDPDGDQDMDLYSYEDEEERDTKQERVTIGELMDHEKEREKHCYEHRQRDVEESKGCSRHEE